MGIQYSQANRLTGPIVETTVGPSTVSALLLAADPLRHDGTIYNKTNQTMYIQWGDTAATVGTSLALPAGANIDLPLDFTGAVQFIVEALTRGNVLIQTISYV